jgi:hypothetical protein
MGYSNGKKKVLNLTCQMGKWGFRNGKVGLCGLLGTLI